MKLSILIPVYNDKEYIRKTIDQIQAVEFPIPYEILAVDDASTDGSKEILEEIPNIKKIFHTKNTGKGGAIATGLKHVTGDIIAIQDDDCEYDPAVLPSLIRPILDGEADAVYGSRFLQKNSMFFIQRLENIAITTLANILVGQRLTDIETGHKVFSSEIAKKIHLTKKGFEFDMEITLQLLRNNARIKELPTRYSARTHAQGKKITYKDGLRSIFTLFKLTPKARIQNILLGALFLAAVFVPRFVELGTTLTVDEPLWLSRGQTFINALSTGNFAKTLVAGQPGITTAWIVGLSSPWQSLTAGQAAIGFTTGILILIITYFFRILLGEKWGLVVGFFLALDPFLIAHSRVVHTDALLALFYMASLVSLLCALTSPSPKRRYVVMSAALASGAILTKIFGLILVPTVLCIIAYILWRKKADWTQIVRTAGLWVSVCILTAFIAWPALWSHSNTVAQYLFARASLHGEGTRIEETTSANWYYTRETFFRLSVPVTLLLPFALWQWRKVGNSKYATTTITLMAAGLFFALVLNTGSDKSDRYILFMHLSLIVLSTLGLHGIVEWLTKNKQLKRYAYIFILVPVLYMALDDIRLHPHYLAHYNRLYLIEATHKLGWGEGLEQAASWITKNHPGAKVYSYYPRVFEYFYPKRTESITHINDAKEGYVVLYRSMLERGPESTEADILNEFLYNKDKKPEHVIVINGLPYVWIYSL